MTCHITDRVAWRGNSIGRVFSVVCLGLWMSLCAGQSLVAGDLRDESSLRFVPADAAFYSASFRQREQWDLLTKSRAFAKLMESPYIKSGWEQVKGFWEAAPLPQVQQFKQLLELPENRQLLDMLADAISHEVFLFGDENVASMIRILNQMNGLNRTAQIEANLGNQTHLEILQRGMLQIFHDNLDDLAVPKFVMGMKVTDKDRASAQLIRLENLVVPLSQIVPQLKGRVQRIAIGDGRFLTLHVDGKQIPWDELLSDKSELDDDQKEQVRAIEAKVKPLELMVCLGLHEDYLTLAIGDSTEIISTLGQGKKLADADELAPILKLQDKRITSIGFASADFVAANSDATGQFRELLTMIGRAIEQVNPDQAQLVEQLEVLTELADAGEAFAQSGVMFLTDRGLEGYSYSWGDDELIDHSQHLTILSYLGGQPLMFAASRIKWGPLDEEYDELKSVASLVYEFGNEMLSNSLEDEQLETYEKVRDQLLPLTDRLENATKKFLLPALADGQIALVVEALTSDTSFHTAMPKSKQPLPLPELAVVLGIKDATLLRQGVSEYAAITQEVLDKLRAAVKDFPEIKIPEPRTKKVDDGEVFAWPLPEVLGLAKAITPSAGLAKNVAVISTSPKQAVRLMQATPLNLEQTVEKLNRPFGEVMVVNFAEMLQLTRPWIDYFVQLYGDKLKAEEGDEALGSVKAIQLQAHAVIDFLSCLKGSSSVTYKEKSAIVTHIETRFQDAE